MKVAVVGIGYAGLVTALFATKKNYDVTIYHDKKIEDNVSYWSTGGMMKSVQMYWTAIKNARIDFTTSDPFFMWAFLFHFILHDSETKKQMFWL